MVFSIQNIGGPIAIHLASSAMGLNTENANTSSSSKQLPQTVICHCVAWISAKSETSVRLLPTVSGLFLAC